MANVNKADLVELIFIGNAGRSGFVRAQHMAEEMWSVISEEEREYVLETIYEESRGINQDVGKEEFMKRDRLTQFWMRRGENKWQ